MIFITAITSVEITAFSITRQLVKLLKWYLLVKGRGEWWVRVSENEDWWLSYRNTNINLP